MSTATKTAEKVKTSRKNQETEKYKVVAYNDDYTSVEFVIGLMKGLFAMDDDTARRVTMQIHQQGAGVCGIYPKAVAEEKVALGTRLAEAEDFPLQLEASQWEPETKAKRGHAPGH